MRISNLGVRHSFGVVSNTQKEQEPSVTGDIEHIRGSLDNYKKGKDEDICQKYNSQQELRKEESNRLSERQKKKCKYDTNNDGNSMHNLLRSQLTSLALIQSLYAPATVVKSV
ncbi:Uncharacterized protein HZ326_29574 [Fusarium oxysporum f. sp. albedinis]|nr:Uncharacterized protein HZ326_29574 [Fusarium oxysporum f. sp. albedinis]